MKRFDFGLGLKAGVEFSQKYQISIGYDWGLVENIKIQATKPQLDDITQLLLLNNIEKTRKDVGLASFSFFHP